MKKRPGRKPLADRNSVRDQRVAVFVTRAEHEALELAAGAERVSVGALIARMALERLREGFAARIETLPEPERSHMRAKLVGAL